MLALFFELGTERYAIPARSVVEVVPKVSLRRIARAPVWLSGMLAYRGVVVPVVDLSRRLLDVDCGNRLSSRIVIVERAAGEVGSRFGIAVERVTEVRPLITSDASGVQMTETPYIRGTVLDAGKLVQLLDIDAVLPKELIQHRTLEA